MEESNIQNHRHKYVKGTLFEENFNMLINILIMREFQQDEMITTQSKRLI
jgi:hypothetical protein